MRILKYLKYKDSQQSGTASSSSVITGGGGSSLADSWFYIDENQVVHCAYDFAGDKEVSAAGDASLPTLAENIVSFLKISEISDEPQSISVGDSYDVAFSKINQNKQDKLISGITLKTIDGSTLLGSGNIQTLDISTVIDVISTMFVPKPVVLYETDGTTGLLGVNSNALGNNWQLENYDFTPYKFLKCYFKMADQSASSNALTPAMVIDLPLDTAVLPKSANDSTSISPKVPCNMYIAGAAAANPSDQNRVFNVLVAVDSTKTKFQVVCENSLYGTAQTNRNTDGRYLYKIEGWYD